MDPGIWNAFITAAGRANQLQRALQALKDMQVWLCCAPAPLLLTPALARRPPWPLTRLFCTGQGPETGCSDARSCSGRLRAEQ